MVVLIGLLALLILSYAILEYEIWAGHDEPWTWTDFRPRDMLDKTRRRT